MTSLRGPAWGRRDWDEFPPAIPPRFRPAVVIGIWCTGAAAGIGLGALIAINFGG